MAGDYIIELRDTPVAEDERITESDFYEACFLGSPISFDRYGNPTVPDWCTHFTRVYTPMDGRKGNFDGN